MSCQPAALSGWFGSRAVLCQPVSLVRVSASPGRPHTFGLHKPKRRRSREGLVLSVSLFYRTKLTKLTG
jgi:hypothetical protein